MSGLAGCAALRVVTHHVEAEAGAVKPGLYRLDRDHQALIFRVGHLDYSHVIGRFDDVAAQLRIDPENLEQAQLSVEIAAASINLPSETLTRLVRGKDLMDVAHYPTLRFVSTAVALTGPQEGDVAGDLTLRGRTRKVVLHVTFNGGAPDPLTGVYKLGFSAKGRLKRSAFGLGAWAPAVADQVDFEIEAEFDLAEIRH